MARLNDLPPEIHLKIATALIDGPVCTSTYNPRSAEWLSQVSDYWRDILISAIEVSKPYIDEFVERDYADTIQRTYLPLSTKDQHTLRVNIRGIILRSFMRLERAIRDRQQFWGPVDISVGLEKRSCSH